MYSLVSNCTFVLFDIWLGYIKAEHHLLLFVEKKSSDSAKGLKSSGILYVYHCSFSFRGQKSAKKLKQIRDFINSTNCKGQR